MKRNEKVKLLRLNLWCWEDDQNIFYIHRKDGGEFTLADIEELLEKHKKETNYKYTLQTFKEYLENQGYKVERVRYDFKLYF